MISQWLYCQVLGLRLLAACVSVDRAFHSPLAYIPALEYLSRWHTYIHNTLSHRLACQGHDLSQFLHKDMLTLHLYCKMLTNYINMPYLYSISHTLNWISGAIRKLSIKFRLFEVTLYGNRVTEGGAAHKISSTTNRPYHCCIKIKWIVDFI